VFPWTPLLGDANHFSLSVCDHPANVPLALTVQPLVPQVGGISDDPFVPLLQYPAEIRSVVVSINRSAAGESVQELGGFVLLEDIDGTVHMKVCGKRVIRGVKAGNAC
jgi:hypothetical protein